MKQILLLSLFFVSLTTFAQDTIKKLNYAKTQISIPENCVAKSEYEIIDCNRFSAQWLFLNDEMIKQKLNEKLFSQIEQQLKFKSKVRIEFKSQNQKFIGNKYKLKNGTYRIIAFGYVNEIPLILNLGFLKDLKNNSDLTEFEKNFISFE